MDERIEELQKTLAGHRPSEVLQLLKSRRDCGGATHHDGRKLCLVVEGGGMRGVLSAGSLLALDLLGYRACFDAVFAVSAGSVNAAYFLSGQGLTGISVYFDDISSKRFINPLRFWKIADVDYVYDYVVPTLKPLDDEAVRRSPQEFYVTATEVQTGNNVLLDAKERSVPVSRFLKASSALPVLYNRTVLIQDVRYMDGGISGGLPVEWAIKHGCTDVLVLLSRPCSYVGKEPQMFERLLFRALIGMKYPALYTAYAKSLSTKEQNRRLALGTDREPDVNVATICPDDVANGVGRTTIDRKKLVDGAYLAGRKVFGVLGEDPKILDKTFLAFH
jgi:predicted patatin/cPLA2 family phospholipase